MILKFLYTKIFNRYQFLKTFFFLLLISLQIDINFSRQYWWVYFQIVLQAYYYVIAKDFLIQIGFNHTFSTLFKRCKLVNHLYTARFFGG